MVVHRFGGFVNPRCEVCGLTPMQAQRMPFAKCERWTLPFDAIELKPAKADLPPAPGKERAIE